MNHKIRYLLFRIGRSIVFHIAWMHPSIRTRESHDDCLSFDHDGITVLSDDPHGPGVGYANLGFDGEDAEERDVMIDLQGSNEGSDDSVSVLTCTTPEIADRLIERTHAAIAAYVRGVVPRVEDVDPAPTDLGPAGFPYNLL